MTVDINVIDKSFTFLCYLSFERFCLFSRISQGAEKPPITPACVYSDLMGVVYAGNVTDVTRCHSQDVSGCHYPGLGCQDASHAILHLSLDLDTLSRLSLMLKKVIFSESMEASRDFFIWSDIFRNGCNIVWQLNRIYKTISRENKLTWKKL